jgi:hypothetical protein
VTASGPEAEVTDRHPGRTAAVVALLAVVAVAAAAIVATLAVTLGGEDASAGADATVAVGASRDGFTVWERNDDGTPVRWDPCTPIDLLVAEDGAPAGFRDDLDTAVAVLREASGLDLEVLGTTDERPSATRPPYQPETHPDRWAPVLVAWAAPHDQGLPLRDVDRGVAIPIAVGPEGARTYVSGQVVFNRDRHDLVPGFDDRATSWGATIVHELAHLLGLGHVDDPAELLWTYPGEGPVELGPGDRAGLTEVGTRHGCRDVPTPRPVEVADPPRPR